MKNASRKRKKEEDEKEQFTDTSPTQADHHDNQQSANHIHADLSPKTNQTPSHFSLPDPPSELSHQSDELSRGGLSKGEMLEAQAQQQATSPGHQPLEPLGILEPHMFGRIPEKDLQLMSPVEEETAEGSTPGSLNSPTGSEDRSSPNTQTGPHFSPRGSEDRSSPNTQTGSHFSPTGSEDRSSRDDPKGAPQGAPYFSSPGMVMSPLAKKKLLSQVCAGGGCEPPCHPAVSLVTARSDTGARGGGGGGGGGGVVAMASALDPVGQEGASLSHPASPETAPSPRPSVIQHAQSFRLPWGTGHERPSPAESCPRQEPPVWGQLLPLPPAQLSSIPDPGARGMGTQDCVQTPWRETQRQPPAPAPAPPPHASGCRGQVLYSSPHLQSLYRHAKHRLSQQHRQQHLGSQVQGCEYLGAQVKVCEHRGAQVQGCDHLDSQAQVSQHLDSLVQGSEHQGAQAQGSELQGAQAQGCDHLDSEAQVSQHLDSLVQGSELQGARAQGSEPQGARAQGSELQGARAQGSEHLVQVSQSRAGESGERGEMAEVAQDVPDVLIDERHSTPPPLPLQFGRHGSKTPLVRGPFGGPIYPTMHRGRRVPAPTQPGPGGYGMAYARFPMPIKDASVAYKVAVAVAEPGALGMGGTGRVRPSSGLTQTPMGVCAAKRPLEDEESRAPPAKTRPLSPPDPGAREAPVGSGACDTHLSDRWGEEAEPPEPARAVHLNCYSSRGHKYGPHARHLAGLCPAGTFGAQEACEGPRAVGYPPLYPLAFLKAKGQGSRGTTTARMAPHFVLPAHMVQGQLVRSPTLTALRQASSAHGADRSSNPVPRSPCPPRPFDPPHTYAPLPLPAAKPSTTL